MGNAFRTGANIHFSNKSILGLGALQHFTHVCYADDTNDTLVMLQGYAVFFLKFVQVFTILLVVMPDNSAIIK